MKVNAEDRHDAEAQKIFFVLVGIIVFFVVFILPWLIVVASYIVEWLPTIPFSIDSYWDWVMSFGPKK